MTKRKWTPKRILKLRQRMGLTQTEFAHALGINRQQTISQWETAKELRLLPAYRLQLEQLEARQ